jgi:hypothetical protein
MISKVNIGMAWLGLLFVRSLWHDRMAGMMMFRWLGYGIKKRMSA